MLGTQRVTAQGHVRPLHSVRGVTPALEISSGVSFGPLLTCPDPLQMPTRGSASLQALQVTSYSGATLGVSLYPSTAGSLRVWVGRACLELAGLFRPSRVGAAWGLPCSRLDVEPPVPVSRLLGQNLGGQRGQRRVTVRL